MQGKETAFFLFINTVSGGGVGLDYLTIQAEQISFRINKRPNIHVYFYDLFNAQSKNKGLTTIKQLYNSLDIRVIICGGDGSVLWVIQQLLDSSIDIHNIIFGIIPIGTGNDFARSLGWTKTTQFSDSNLGSLKGILKEWLKAEIRKYDIWDFDMELYEGGDVRRIKDKREVVVEDKRIHRSFSNYFGVGIDARIGYSFDKRRTGSRLGNMICYGCIGLFKWCKKAVHMDDLVDNMHEGEISEIEAATIKQEELLNQTQRGMKDNESKLVFHTDKQSYGHENILKPGFKNILCMNSTNFMGGVKNIWTTTKSALTNTGEDSREWREQDFGDGELEFVSFRNELQLGMERYVPGRGSKLTQGSGPFAINFKKSDKKVETFLQIDGQFYKVTNPKSIRVVKTSKFQGSQINVMVRRK